MIASRIRPSWRLLLVVAALSAALVSLDRAHALEPVFTEPHVDDTLDHAPEAILVQFDELLLLEPGANSVAIIDAEGHRVDDHKATIASYSQRTMIAHLEEGVEIEGPLRVVWLVQSAETGETSQGEFRFAVEAGAVHEAPAEPAGQGVPSSRSNESIVLWTVGILIASGLFTSALYLLRLKNGLERSSLEDPGAAAHH